MIIKGKSRGGPVQLARHLLRQDTNETVKILQLDSPTGDLREAERDWQLMASGTQGTLGLYHANISPDRAVSRGQLSSTAGAPTPAPVSRGCATRG
jgi:hypothetical protein